MTEKRIFKIKLQDNKHVDVVHLFRTMRDAYTIADKELRCSIVQTLASLIKGVSHGLGGGFTSDELSCLREGNFMYYVSDDNTTLTASLTITKSEPVVVSVLFEDNSGQTSISAVMSNGDEEKLFSYYPDELSFSSSEFIGKTAQESRQIFSAKDIAYIQAG